MDRKESYDAKVESSHDQREAERIRQLWTGGDRIVFLEPFHQPRSSLDMGRMLTGKAGFPFGSGISFFKMEWLNAAASVVVSIWLGLG